MNKLEKVARAIGDIVKLNSHDFKTHKVTPSPIAINAAQAAIDALGLLILEKGAEPMIGDVMYTLGEENRSSPSSYVWHKDFIRKGRMKDEIIDRQGQRVIMEDE